MWPGSPLAPGCLWSTEQRGSRERDHIYTPRSVATIKTWADLSFRLLFFFFFNLGGEQEELSQEALADATVQILSANPGGRSRGTATSVPLKGRGVMGS